jgi:heat shock protein HslJ
LTRNVLLGVWLAAFGVAMAGCDNQSNSSSAGPTGPSSLQQALSDHEWRLDQIDGKPALSDVKVTALFADDRVSGSAGCNRYTGGASINGNQLSISPLASTRMFCNAPGVMAQEDRYLQVLGAAASFTIVNGRLVVATAQNSTALVYADQ